MIDLEAIRKDDEGWSAGYVAADPNGLIAQRRALLALVDELRAELAGARKDAERFKFLCEKLQIGFKDDNGLWVATWRRATGDVFGIIRARIDSALSASQTKDEGSK